ncbi:MAG: metal-dependent hydrolase [Candidatus Binatia bacterium]
MPARKTPAGILVRRISFSYPADLRAHWHGDKPEWSQMVNAASLLMPYLEPYLIEAIRDALPRITDPELAEEARGYMGQEAHHYKQHRRFNELLLAPDLGYESLRAHEADLESDYARFRRERGLDFHLAYAAGFETMALAIGHMLINGREYYFRNADPAVSSLVLWHFVEELEHKHAAFDVYQHVVGRYWMRIYGLLFAMHHTLSRTRRAYVMLLKRDGLWGRWRTRLQLKLVLAKIFVDTMPWILESLLPWHRPSRFADPEWARDWVRLYDTGDERLVHLDTRQIHLAPSAMLAPSAIDAPDAPPGAPA